MLGDLNKIKVFDFREIGEMVQSPTNLEIDGDNGKWIRWDGRVLPRSKFSSEFLRKYQTPGQFTFTTRTTVTAPSVASIGADATYFVIGGTSSATTQLQTSVDGNSWSNAAGTGTVVSNIAMIYTGTNWVIASSGTTKAYYSANPTSTFTIGGSGAVAVASDANCFAYSPSLGRLLHVPNTAGTSVYTSDDNGATWTTRTTASSKTKSQAVWTGTTFAVTCNDTLTLQTSADGITWADFSMPVAYTGTDAALSKIASNGSGTVVTLSSADNGVGVGTQYSYLVSKDNCATWSIIPIPISQDTQSTTGFGKADMIVCANNVFFSGWSVTTITGFTFGSKDGISWSTMGNQGNITNVRNITYKSGLYACVGVTTTSSTMTEDVSKVVIGRTQRPTGTNATPTTGGNMGQQEYIKVR